MIQSNISEDQCLKKFKPNKRGNLITKVVYKKKIPSSKMTIITTHILAHPDAKSATFLDIVAKSTYAEQLMKLIQINGFYKFNGLKAYVDKHFKSKLAAYYDNASTVIPIQLNKVQRHQLNNVDWKSKIATINENYNLKTINLTVVAGFIHSLPIKVNHRLFTMQIRNQKDETKKINLWMQELPPILKNAQKNQVMIIPKVNHSPPFRGISALNVNGPIYLEQIWDIPPTTGKIVDLSIIDAQNAKGMYMTHFFDIFFCN